MTVPGAVWCLACGQMPDVAITVERNGTMAHYGACWDHLEAVARRCRRENDRGPQPISAAQRPGVVDVTARDASHSPAVADGHPREVGHPHSSA